MQLQAGAVKAATRICRLLPPAPAQALASRLAPYGHHIRPKTVRLSGGATIVARPDTLIGWSLYCLSAYEPEVAALLAAIALPGTTFVDVGANVGVHSLEAASRGCIVHAFEPHPRTFERLTTNIGLNAGLAVHAHNWALSDARGAGELSDPPPYNDGMACTHPLGGWDRIPIQLDTLDDIDDRQPLGSITGIKIDVEGQEVRVLRGASRVVAQHRPYIVFEYLRWAWEAAGFTFGDASTLLYDWHYGLFALGSVGLKPLPRGILLPPEGNLVAVPLPRSTAT